MQTLTVKEVIAACRRGLEDGTLLAEAKERGDVTSDQCVYYDRNGHYCAIGIALTKDTLADLNGTNPSVFGLDPNIINFTIDNLNKLNFIQQTHDDWMKGVGTKSEFIEALDELEREATAGDVDDISSVGEGL